MDIFQILTHKLLNILILSSSTLTLFIDLLKDWKGTFGFLLFTLLALYIKLAKFSQEQRHREEKHRQDLEQEHDEHLKNMIKNKN